MKFWKFNGICVLLGVLTIAFGHGGAWRWFNVGMTLVNTAFFIGGLTATIKGPDTRAEQEARWRAGKVPNWR